MAEIIGTPISEFIIGTPEDDFILALAGNDTVLGLGGSDTINGNEGNDILNGNEGNDLVRGGMGNDLVRGGQNDDELYGDLGNDTLYGDFGRDRVYGGAGADLLFGNDGNDTLNGNEGNDTIRGGQGNDFARGGKDNDLIFGDLGNDTLFGDLGDDTILGNDNDDVINGNEGNDILNGNEGNDTVRGGQGDDLVRGGQDNDEVYGDLGNDTLYGDFGNDSVFGGAGTDLLFGNEGNDVLNGNEGNDTAFGGEGNDLVRGGMDNDSLLGESGNDTLFGDLGDDTLYGGADNDLLYGDQGPFLGFGGAGNDVVFGNEGLDTIYGAGGNDLLFGNEDNDLIFGNEGQDTLRGGQGNDTLRGGKGNDILFGDKGNDVLFGDLGADTLTGDIAGEVFTDIFVLGRVTDAPTKTTGGPTRADADVITDFQLCIDLISLTGGVAYEDLLITQGTGADAGNTIIQDKGTNEFLVVLQGVDSSKVDGTSFIINGMMGTPTVTITATDPLASEPVAGQAINPGEFTISIPCPIDQPLDVSYTIGGNATAGLDYQAIPLTARIPAGATSVTIPILPIGDNLVEQPETVTLTLTERPGYRVEPARFNNTATVTILDAPPITPPPVERSTIIVSAIDPVAGEPGRPEGTGTFQFARTGGDPTQTVRVRFTITGTATPDDYTLSANEVIFGPGDFTPKTITLTPTGAGGIEPTETVVLAIAQDPSYIVGASDIAIVRIIDDRPLQLPNDPNRVLIFDSAGTFKFGRNDITIAVNDAAANDIVFVRAGTYNEPGTITIDKPLTVRGPNAGISPASGFSVEPAIVTTMGMGLGNPIFVVNPGLTNVTIEGLTIRLRGDNGIRQQGGSNNLTIRQNEFTGDGPPNGGVIFLDFNATGSGANVIDNLIRDVNPATVTSGVQLFRINNVRTSDNQLANLSGPGIVADAITGTNLINRNSLDNIRDQGIQLAGGSATIANNDITNANTARTLDNGGIRLRNSGLTTATLGTVDVLSNVIVNSFNGVAIRPDTTIPAGVRVNFNNLINNSNAGLLHAGTGTLDATNNWWDRAAGPEVIPTGGAPFAIAGPAAGQVTFTPFATQPL